MKSRGVDPCYISTLMLGPRWLQPANEKQTDSGLQPVGDVGGGGEVTGQDERAAAEHK